MLSPVRENDRITYIPRVNEYSLISFQDISHFMSCCLHIERKITFGIRWLKDNELF